MSIKQIFDNMDLLESEIGGYNITPPTAAVTGVIVVPTVHTIGDISKAVGTPFLQANFV